MTYTEKRLEEFDKRYYDSELVLIEGKWLNVMMNCEDSTTTCKNEIRQLLIESIQQAVAEDRERVVKLVAKDIQSAPHCNSSHSELLSSLDTNPK